MICLNLTQNQTMNSLKRFAINFYNINSIMHWMESVKIYMYDVSESGICTFERQDISITF